MRFRPTLLASVAFLALISGCTGTGPGPGPLPLPGGAPAVQVQQGPAPSGTEEEVSVRVDEVTRVGDDLAIALTLATSRQEAAPANRARTVAPEPRLSPRRFRARGECAPFF